MKKFLMVLLSIAFVLNLTIVIGPGSFLYVIVSSKKSIVLSQLSKAMPFKPAYLRYAVCGCCLCIKNANCYRRWTDGLSIFFCILGLCKRDKIFL